MRFHLRHPLTEMRRGPGRLLTTSGLVVALAITPAVFVPQLYDDFTLAKQASLLVATALVLGGMAWDGEFLPRNPAIRRLTLAWIVLLLLGFVAGIDSRGSILGYYQYRQGLLTQLAYVALFLGSLKVARESDSRWIGAGGALGLSAVAAYTAIQAVGRDPVTWWVDTSARAVGTIGNANELAAYAVIALALCAFGQRYSARTAALWTGAVAACSAFIMLESESRSGLVALGTSVLAYPLAALVAGCGWRAASQRWLVLFAGLAAGAAASALAGGATETAARVQTGLVQSETTGSTRVELWKGTFAAIAHSPLLGSGPDGLRLAFPLHRPGDLGGAFLDYDLVVQSSHNAALDIAANQGVPALFVLTVMLGVVAARSARVERQRKSNEVPFIWAAMGGYVALTLVNPVSLAPQALFFVLAGMLSGRSERGSGAPPVRRFSAPLRLALASPAIAILLAIATFMPLADRKANRAWGHFANNEFGPAAADYNDAHRLLPFERAYATSMAEAWLADGVVRGAPALREAVDAYEALDQQFGLTSDEVIGLITARIGLGATAGLTPLIERSLALNPHGVFISEYTTTLRVAAASGGTLHYAEADRWVYVVPNVD